MVLHTVPRPEPAETTMVLATPADFPRRTTGGRDHDSCSSNGIGPPPLVSRDSSSAGSSDNLDASLSDASARSLDGPGPGGQAFG